MARYQRRVVRPDVTATKPRAPRPIASVSTSKPTTVPVTAVKPPVRTTLTAVRDQPLAIPKPSIMDWQPEVTVEVSTNDDGIDALLANPGKRLLLILTGSVAEGRTPNLLWDWLLRRAHQYASRVRIQIVTTNAAAGSVIAERLCSTTPAYRAVHVNPAKTATPFTDEPTGEMKLEAAGY